jgi:hypothetical protein
MTLSDRSIGITRRTSAAAPSRCHDMRFDARAGITIGHLDDCNRAMRQLGAPRPHRSGPKGHSRDRSGRKSHSRDRSGPKGDPSAAWTTLPDRSIEAPGGPGVMPPQAVGARSSRPQGSFPRSIGPKGSLPRSIGPKGSLPRSIGPKGSLPRSIGPKGRSIRGMDDPFGPIDRGTCRHGGNAASSGRSAIDRAQRVTPAIEWAQRVTPPIDRAVRAIHARGE